MRDRFVQDVISIHSNRDTYFLSGDLGFMALEPLQKAFSERFINAGVAEQNMVGVASGLARTGSTVFVYSIAPFAYARPFEQIRNDIGFHDLPVCIVGNGGGYAYGHMGPTHHSLEDCSVMRSIGMNVLVPVFDSDIAPILEHLPTRTYLRLGRDESKQYFSEISYKPWRELIQGGAGHIVALGPIAGGIGLMVADLPWDKRPSVWAVSQLDCSLIPEKFLKNSCNSNLIIVEEHYQHGGLGMALLYHLSQAGIALNSVTHLHAAGYPSSRFGSQQFHRAESGLDLESIRRAVLSLRNE